VNRSRLSDSDPGGGTCRGCVRPAPVWPAP
jgi:hypothetical protein